MQVDFNFSPTRVAVVCESTQVRPFILLGRIEVSMNKRPSLRISELFESSRIFKTPPLQPSFLFCFGSSVRPTFRHNGRFKMIGERKDQVSPTAARMPPQALPKISRYPAPSVAEFLLEADSRLFFHLHLCFRPATLAYRTGASSPACLLPLCCNSGRGRTFTTKSC